MKRTILNIMTVLALLLLPAGMLASSAYAACGTDSPSKTDVLTGIGQTGGSTDCSTAQSGVTNVISAAVNILSLVVGIAAIIMIISSGLKYVTSGGDAQKVGNAKNTLVYAVVGLVVAALAQFLVHFVLNTTNDNTPGSCSSNSALAANDPNCK